MSSISNLLTRNLQDVFGENDPVRRRVAIDEIFTQDGVFYDPINGAHRGRTRSIASRARSELRTRTFCYQPIAEPEEPGNGGRSSGWRDDLVSARVLRRDRFHHRKGRPDCGPLSLFRQATLSRFSPPVPRHCKGTSS